MIITMEKAFKIHENTQKTMLLLLLGGPILIFTALNCSVYVCRLQWSHPWILKAFSVISILTGQGGSGRFGLQILFIIASTCPSEHVEELLSMLSVDGLCSTDRVLVVIWVTGLENLRGDWLFWYLRYSDCKSSGSLLRHALRNMSKNEEILAIL